MINNKVPKRRFKGFTDDWEQRKLGEISNIVGGGTPSTEVESYWNGNINWYSPAEIGSHIYVSNSKRKITELGLEKSSARLLPVGTVLFTSRAGIGNMAILKEKACTNQGFQSIIPVKNKLNSYFIFSRSNELKKYAETVGAGSTFVEVSGKQMSEMEIKIPQIKEQVKIAYLFTNLDNLITLHQRKLKKLVDLKSSYLEKMFPEGNKNIPKLRFKNFNNTEVWNVKSLKELGYTYNSLSGMTKEDFDNGTSKYITYLNVFHNSITRISELEKVRVNKKQNKVLNGDVFFTTSSETPEEVGMSSVWTHDLDDVYLNSFCFGYRFYDKFSPYFTANLFRSNGFRKEIELLAQGISRFNISKQRVMDLSISYPSVNEQKTIGNFFSKLDNIIKLQNKKLNKLKDLKQAYLNEMFVN